MRSVTITIVGEVVPKQSVRATAIPYFNDKTQKCDCFMKVYQTKKIKDYETLVRFAAQNEVGTDFKPLEGTLAVSGTLVFDMPKSMPQYIKDAVIMGGTVYKGTEPDLTDNLLKGIFDGMKDIIYKNDGQIALIKEMKKIYGVEPRAVITIEEISQTNSLLI